MSSMRDIEFEGSEILEQLAEIDLLDSFMDAIDSDNLGLAVTLMRRAGLNQEAINHVLDEIGN